MTGPQIALIVAIAIVVDFVIVGGILYGIVHFIWNPLVERYPTQPAQSDAVTRRFQSFRIGVVNLGWSVHVTVDETHLHLDPARVPKLLGFKPMSVPWDGIEYRKQLRQARYTEVCFGTEKVVGPTWCLELAKQDDAAT